MIEVDETNELSQVSCCGRLWELADNFNLGEYPYCSHDAPEIPGCRPRKGDAIVAEALESC